MKLQELARAIEARLIIPNGSGNPNIVRVYGGTTMSDLIANAAADTLLVTSLNNSQLIRVADLMDVPGICLVDGCEPAVDLVYRARATDTALLVSKANLVETCARATVFLATEKTPQP